MLVNNPELLPDIKDSFRRVGKVLLGIVNPKPYVLPEHFRTHDDPIDPMAHDLFDPNNYYEGEQRVFNTEEFKAQLENRDVES